MPNTFAMLILVMIIIIEDYQCKDIYVSLVNGEDINYCGSNERKCKSITYAFERRADDNDTLYIDGGENNSIIYKLNYTINITRPIYIKKFSNLNPIISSNKLLHTHSFAFSIGQARFFSIDSINFKSINVLYVNYLNTNSNHTIQIKSCMVENEVTNETYAAINITTKSLLSLSLKDCNFNHPKIANVRVENEAMLISFVNISTMGAMYFNCKNCEYSRSNIEIQNITASKEANFQVLGIFSSVRFNNLKIFNVAKSNHQKPLINFQQTQKGPVTPVLLKGCSFINNTIKTTLINMASNYNVTIQSNYFVNNHVQYMLHIDTLNQILLQRSNFINNIVEKGIIHAVSKNGILSRLNKFKNNLVQDDMIQIVSNNNLTIILTSFLGNDVTYMMYANSYNNITFISGTILQNNVGLYAFQVVFNNRVHLIGSNLYQNSVNYMIILTSINDINISSCKINQNIVKYDMLYAASNNSIVLLESNIQQNKVRDDMIQINSSNIVNIINSNINKNTVTYNMLYANSNNTMNIIRSNIQQNNVKKTILSYNRLKNNSNNSDQNIVTKRILYASSHNIIKFIDTNISHNNMNDMLVMVSINTVLIFRSNIRYNHIRKDMIQADTNNSISLIANNIYQNDMRNMLHAASVNNLNISDSHIYLNKALRYIFYVLTNNSVNVIVCNIYQNRAKRNMLFVDKSNSLHITKSNINENNVKHSMLEATIKNTVKISNSNLNQNFVWRMLYLQNDNYLNISSSNIKQNIVVFILYTFSNNNINFISINFHDNIALEMLYLHKLDSLNIIYCNIYQNNVTSNLIPITYNNSLSIINTNIYKNHVGRNILSLFYYNTVNIIQSNITQNNGTHILLSMSNNHIKCIRTNIVYNDNFREMINLNSSNILYLNEMNIKNNIVTNNFFGLLNKSNHISLEYCYIHENTIGGYLSFVAKHNINISYTSCVIENNTVNLDLLRAESNVHIRINSCHFKNNEMRNMISVEDSKINICFSKFNRNKIKRGMFNFRQSEVRMISTNIRHDEIYYNGELFKYEENSKNVSVFIVKDLNITWGSSLPIFLPIIRITARNSKVNITNLSINVKKLIEKVQVFFISVDTNTYRYNNNILVSSYIQCPNSFYLTHNDNTDGIIEHYCSPCDVNTYNLISPQYNITTKTKTFIKEIRSPFHPYPIVKEITVSTKTTATNTTERCLQCPVGGKCKHSIKSSGNFFGYQTDKDEIEFLPCPLSYCCSRITKPCDTFHTCNFNRSGILCGSCDSNHFESYFTTKCMHKKQCRNQISFWVIYCTFAILTSLLLLFLTDLKNTFSRISAFIKEKLSLRERYKVKEYTHNPTQSQFSLNEKYTSKNYSCRDSVGKIGTNNSRDINKHRSYTFSGIVSLLVTFYQTKKILTVDIAHAYKTSNKFDEAIGNFFNFDVAFDIFSSYCPTETLNALTKLLLKYILFTSLMLFAIAIVAFTTVTLTSLYIYNIQNRAIKKKYCHRSLMKKIMLCYVRILCFSYQNIALFFIILLHCENINGQSHLYIMGNTTCFNWWQILPATFFVPWVILFPLVLSISFDLYSRKYISLQELLVALLFPPCTFIFWLRKVFPKVGNFVAEDCLEELLETFQEPYIEKQDENDWFLLWESWRLYERLILSIVTNFVIQPMLRMCLIGPILLLFVIIYWKVKPYKENMVVLHWMNIISLMGFCFIAIFNMFASVLYVYDTPNSTQVQVVLRIFRFVQYLFTPIIVILVFFIVIPLFNVVEGFIKGKRD